MEKELTPGDKSFEIDIPEDTYGYFEFEIPKATVGAELYWEIRLNGNLVGREKQRLDQPLENNSAFFLQFEFNDLSEVREQMKEPFIRGEGDNQ